MSSDPLYVAINIQHCEEAIDDSTMATTAWLAGLLFHILSHGHHFSITTGTCSITLSNTGTSQNIQNKIFVVAKFSPNVDHNSQITTILKAVHKNRANLICTHHTCIHLLSPSPSHSSLPNCSDCT